MSEEQVPSVEEIKERLKIEIPIEEEVSKSEAQSVDVAAELKDLGRQVAETFRTAWNSEERHRLEQEVREGVRSFADEVDKVIREARDSQAGTRIREEAEQVATKVDESDTGQKVRSNMVQGLHWLSEELGKLADKFTPPEAEEEKSPE